MPRTIVRPLQEFLHWEAASGLVLLAATAAALIWANLSEGTYQDVWSTEISLRLGDDEVSQDLGHLVDDGLMALFFFVVGMEVKRELAVGELSDRRAALLPLFAAVGGMVAPAAIFLAATGGGEGANGWGIPMATDIAFALGVLALLGRRVPAALAAFLLGLAVIDDIGAIVVIAIFYSGGVEAGWLVGAVALLGAMMLANRLQIRWIGVYIVLGLAVWLCTVRSGVHATIAGVAIGLLTPARPFQPPAAVSREAYRIADDTSDQPADPDADAHAWRRLASLSRESISPLARVEHALHPWTSFAVLPIFALANAGIVLDGETLRAAAESTVTLGVIAGLVLGKTVGIAGGALLATRLRLARLPYGVGRLELVGVGAVAGIGFTVSLFIAGLAYEDAALASAAKIGILSGSVLAAGLGSALLLLAFRRRARAGGSP